MATRTLAIALVTVILLGVFGSVSCGPRDSGLPGGPVPVRLGFRPTVVVDLALMLAIESGAFRSAGLEVTLQPFGRADLLLAALDGGQIDGSLGIPLEPLLALAAKGQYPYKGFGIWYFDQSTPYDGFLVPVGSSLSTVESLSRLTVGSHPSRQVKYFVESMVPEATVREYNPVSPLLSLAAGEHAAVYVLEPTISQALDSGRYRLLESGSISRRIFDGRRVPAALSVLSVRWTHANPDATSIFLRVATNAYKQFTLADARDDVVTLLSKKEYGGFTSAVAKRVVEPFFSLTEDLDQVGLQRFQDVLIKGELLSAKIDSNQLLLRTAR